MTRTWRPRRLVPALVVVAVVVVALVVWGVSRAGTPAGDPTAVVTPAPEATVAPSTPAPTGAGGVEGDGGGDAAGDVPGAPTPTQPGEPAEPAPEVLELLAEIEPGTVHLPPVEPGEIAHIAEGVTVTLDAVDQVNAQASGRGEVSGPAVALRFTLTNAGDGPLTLDDAVVNLYVDAGVSGSLYASDPRADPFAGTVEPGGSVSATYVVSLPQRSDGTLVVSLSVGPGAPTPLFTTTVSEES
jgi:hypothetical protein